MAERPLRLLLSARDPGAAHGLLPVARKALADARFDVSVVASPPAADIFSRAGIPLQPSVAGAGMEALLREADELLRRYAPDALLVGLSGPDVGIDEALLARAHGVPSFALQDYWGDVNGALGRLADLYFVADEEARLLTAALHGAQGLVVGAPKYAAYAELDPSAARARARSMLGLDAQAPLVGFFGQDLWAYEGYARTLDGLAAAIDAAASRPALLYRPHPKEDPARVDDALALFRRHGLAAKLGPELSAEEAICACDAAATVYSTVCYDAAHLNRVAAVPMASPLYLVFEPDLRARVWAHTGIDFLPPVREGVCGEVRERETLGDAIAEALTPSRRAVFWRAARERLRAAADAVDAILAAIVERARPSAGRLQA